VNADVKEVNTRDNGLVPAFLRPGPKQTARK